MTDVDEYDRDNRIEAYYDGWSARGMAERIVELEDEAEASASVESDRLAALSARDAEIAQLRGAWRVAVATLERYRTITRGLNDTLREYLSTLTERVGERDRYRLAWLSARRRAADEANFGMEALELRDGEIRRLKAELETLRKSTYGAPRLERMGTVDGDEVWRLESS